MTPYTYRRTVPLEQRYRRLRLRPVSPRILGKLSTANDRTLDTMHRDWWAGESAPWIISSTMMVSAPRGMSRDVIRGAVQIMRQDAREGRAVVVPDLWRWERRGSLEPCPVTAEQAKAAL
jgi:hypothetical protein